MKRPYVCPFGCPDEMPFDEAEEHMQRCPKAIDTCPWSALTDCDFKGTRQAMAAHVADRTVPLHFIDITSKRFTDTYRPPAINPGTTSYDFSLTAAWDASDTTRRGELCRMTYVEPSGGAVFDFISGRSSHLIHESWHYIATSTRLTADIAALSCVVYSGQNKVLARETLLPSFGSADRYGVFIPLEESEITRADTPLLFTFHVEIARKPVGPDFLCPWTKMILVEPYRNTACGHHVSKECLDWKECISTWTSTGRLAEYWLQSRPCPVVGCGQVWCPTTAYRDLKFDGEMCTFFLSASSPQSDVCVAREEEKTDLSEAFICPYSGTRIKKTMKSNACSHVIDQESYEAMRPQRCGGGGKCPVCCCRCLFVEDLQYKYWMEVVLRYERGAGEQEQEQEQEQELELGALFFPGVL